MLAGIAAAAGCGGGDVDDSCGPDGAPVDGLTASGAVTLTYGHLVARQNNDCPGAGAPAGVISLTLQGTQADGSGQITLCIARPDLLAGQAQTLGADVAGTQVRVVDLDGTASTCTLSIDHAQPITGSATSTGLCGNGTQGAGFALTLDGALSLARTCGATVDSVAIALHGRVAVGYP